MKNLISTLILGGSLALNGCGIGELEKFNQNNKQVYEDFKEFCNKHPSKERFSEEGYLINYNGKPIDFSKNFLLFKVDIGDTTFYDHHLDGLDTKFEDSYVFRDKNTGLMKVEEIKDLPPEKQLENAKKYTNGLKEIMHEEKYKNY